MDFFRFPAALRFALCIEITRNFKSIAISRSSLSGHKSISTATHEIFERGIFGSRGIFQVANIASEIPAALVSKSWNLTVNRRINKLNCMITRDNGGIPPRYFSLFVVERDLFIYLSWQGSLVRPRFINRRLDFHFVARLLTSLPFIKCIMLESWPGRGRNDDRSVNAVLKQNSCALTFSYSLYVMDLFN